jgi:hypothetical protein
MTLDLVAPSTRHRLHLARTLICPRAASLVPNESIVCALLVAPLALELRDIACSKTILTEFPEVAWPVRVGRRYPHELLHRIGRDLNELERLNPRGAAKCHRTQTSKCRCTEQHPRNKRNPVRSDHFSPTEASPSPTHTKQMPTPFRRGERVPTVFRPASGTIDGVEGCRLARAELEGSGQMPPPLCTHRVSPESAVPIDISPFLRSVVTMAQGVVNAPPDPALRMLLAQVREAAEGPGYFTVVGHGIEDQVVTHFRFR